MKPFPQLRHWGHWTLDIGHWRHWTLETKKSPRYKNPFATNTNAIISLNTNPNTKQNKYMTFAILPPLFRINCNGLQIVISLHHGGPAPYRQNHSFIMKRNKENEYYKYVSGKRSRFFMLVKIPVYCAWWLSPIYQ